MSGEQGEPAAPRFMDVALELSGGKSKDPNAKPVIKKLAKSPTSLRFIVQKLPSHMDADTAGLVTAMLMDEMERLPVPGRVAKVTLSSMRFSEQGAVILQGFLQGHAGTIRHVALNNLMAAKDYHDEDDHDEEASSVDSTEPGIGANKTLASVMQIVHAFAKSPLTVLDFSRNTLQGAALWKPFKNARSLKQLIMDTVDLDQEAWLALSGTFVWEGMDDLHVVLDNCPPSEEALQATQQIVGRCTNLSSLRWIQKKGPDRPLPLKGLRRMAESSDEGGSGGRHNISSSASVSSGASGRSKPGSLKHLVLEGPGTPDFLKSQDMTDLTSALQGMPRLKTLKLRHMGLSDLASFVVSLRAARPPVEVIDFSYNEISSSGAHRLVDLMRVNRIAQSLAVLVMNDNRLETNVAKDLLETFANVITLDNNPGVDFTRVITELLAAKSDLERERDDLRKQLETRAYETGGANAEIIQKENRRLREERDLLAKAFSVMGVAHQVDEHKRLLDRVQRLEDMVVLGAVLKDGSVSGRGVSSSHSHDSSSLGGKNASRRRINVNDLPIERLTHAAQAASSAGRNPSARSMNSGVGLSRSHSNRSNVSRGGGSLNSADDEAAPAVTESPHTNRHSIQSGRPYARTPQSPGPPNTPLTSSSSLRQPSYMSQGGGSPSNSRRGSRME